MNNQHDMHGHRIFDHADIDGLPVETLGIGSSDPTPPATPGPSRSAPPHPLTEDDQDVDAPVDQSHYGDDVERDSDA